MKISKILFFIILFLNFKVSAQNVDSTKHSGEFWIGAQSILPSGEFAKKSGILLGIGLDFGFVFTPIKTDDLLQVGIDFGIDYFGKVKDSILKTNSNLYTINLVSRFKGPAKGRVQTYVDVLAGGKFFILATHNNNNIDDILFGTADYTTLKSKTSSVFSYGLGIGFKLKPKNKNASRMLDLRCTYLASGSMIYDLPSYKETWVSQTNMILPQVSYIYVFKGKKNTRDKESTCILI